MSKIAEKYEIETPCGETIGVTVSNTGRRRYVFSDGTVWNPETAHRVELQLAILDNDKAKYKAANHVEND